MATTVPMVRDVQTWLQTVPRGEAQSVGDIMAKSFQCRATSLQRAAYAQVMSAPSNVLTNQVAIQQYASPHMAHQQVYAPENQVAAQHHACATWQGAQVDPSQWNMPQFKQPSYVPPPSLTAGLPDPESVEQQKNQYLQSIAAREEQIFAALEQQRQCHLTAIHEQAEQQRKHILLLIDNKVRQMERDLALEFNNQVAQTKQQHNDLRSALEHQAIQLVAEFQQKHLQDVAMKEQAKLDQEKEVSNRKYQLEMQKLQQLQHQPAHIMQTPSYVPPVETAIGMNAPPQSIATQSELAHSVPTTTGSYVPPPMTRVDQGHATSYVPPVTVPITAKIGSYVPPPMFLGSMPNEAYGVQLPIATGSYVPPEAATSFPTMGSCAPEKMQSIGNGSYVPPPTVVGMIVHQPTMPSV